MKREKKKRLALWPPLQGEITLHEFKTHFLPNRNQPNNKENESTAECTLVGNSCSGLEKCLVDPKRPYNGVSCQSRLQQWKTKVLA